jgi:hypothetical protein
MVLALALALLYFSALPSQEEAKPDLKPMLSGSSTPALGRTGRLASSAIDHDMRGVFDAPIHRRVLIVVPPHLQFVRPSFHNFISRSHVFKSMTKASTRLPRPNSHHGAAQHPVQQFWWGWLALT